VPSCKVVRANEQESVLPLPELDALPHLPPAPDGAAAPRV
jgi:hypothetical protein